MATETEQREETVLEKEIRAFLDSHKELCGHIYRNDMQTKLYQFLRDYRSQKRKAKTVKKNKEVTADFLKRLHQLLDYVVGRPSQRNLTERTLLRDFVIKKMGL